MHALGHLAKALIAFLYAAILAAAALVSGCSYDPAAGASWKLRLDSPNFGTLTSDVKLTPGIVVPPVPAATQPAGQ